LKNRLFSCDFSVKTDTKISRQYTHANCAVLPKVVSGKWAVNTEKENRLLADVCCPDQLIKVQSYDYTLCVQVMICACAAKL
jgi:hypothetical protein